MEKALIAKKDLAIETLRGITIILMVAGHVVGGDKTGLKTEGDSLLRYIFYVFAFIRMPMFTAISGYIYASHAIRSFDEWTPFIQRKATRLLIPLFTVATLFYLFKKLVPDVNTPAPEFSAAWKVYFLSYEHFWFVQAIFLVFVLVSVLEAFQFLQTVQHWLLLTAVAFAGSVLLQIPSHVFSVDRVPYLLSFFLLGLGLKRFHTEMKAVRANVVLGVLFAIVFVVQQILYFKKLPLQGIDLKLLSNVVGISGIATIIYLRPISKWFAWIGYYSFGIYLLHVFGTAGMRIGLKTMGVESKTILFLLSLFAGVAIPILFQQIIEKKAILNLLFFGQGLKKKGRVAEVKASSVKLLGWKRLLSRQSI